MDATLTARIIGTARRTSGLTAAEFDYSLSAGTQVRPGDDHLNTAAGTAIYHACYAIATEGMRDEQGTPSRPLAELDEAATALYTEMRPEIDALTAAARTKSYTGWSSASTGPIRYAR